MDGQIHQQMRDRFNTKKLAVHHVGDPCQRMPVRNICEAKSPLYVLQNKPVFNVAICCYIYVIVKIKKLMVL